MQPNVHNMLALVLTPTLYIEHMCDTVDTLGIAIRPNRNGYHPIERDNEMVDLCPTQYQLALKIDL